MREIKNIALSLEAIGVLIGTLKDKILLDKELKNECIKAFKSDKDLEHKEVAKKCLERFKRA